MISCTLFDGVLPVPNVPVRITHGALAAIGTLMRLLTAEPRSTATLLFLSQYLIGTILLIMYSMLEDWQVLCSGQCLYFPQRLALILVLLLSLLSFDGLVL